MRKVAGDPHATHAERPSEVLGESVRILRDGGRLLVLQSIDDKQPSELASRLAGWCARAGLRLAPARSVPARNPMWLLAVATRNDAAHAAA